MKKLNGKGFTLIELLAVITIMGILMLVAIPAVSRTIENSRRDTFADVAKEYVNTVRNAVLADELKCGDESVGATGDGTYYFKIDSNEQNTKDIMESGGLSSWSNARVAGFVQWVKTTTAATTSAEQKVKTTYSVYLVDAGKHGIALIQITEAATKYEMRAQLNVIQAHSCEFNYGLPYIGIMQEQSPGDIGISCHHLRRDCDDLKEFLIKTN